MFLFLEEKFYKLIEPELCIKNSIMIRNPCKNGHVRQFWFSS